MPVFAPGRGQVGKATSHGWSPILKQAIALASVPPTYERLGARLEMEWTVEGRRGRVAATVTELPFLDLPRKRSVGRPTATPSRAPRPKTDDQRGLTMTDRYATLRPTIDERMPGWTEELADVLSYPIRGE